MYISVSSKIMLRTRGEHASIWTTRAKRISLQGVPRSVFQWMGNQNMGSTSGAMEASSLEDWGGALSSQKDRQHAPYPPVSLVLSAWHEIAAQLTQDE